MWHACERLLGTKRPCQALLLTQQHPPCTEGYRERKRGGRGAGGGGGFIKLERKSDE
jgi:hypothetical protein